MTLAQAQTDTTGTDFGDLEWLDELFYTLGSGAVPVIIGILIKVLRAWSVHQKDHALLSAWQERATEAHQDISERLEHLETQIDDLGEKIADTNERTSRIEGRLNGDHAPYPEVRRLRGYPFRRW